MRVPALPYLIKCGERGRGGWKSMFCDRYDRNESRVLLRPDKMYVRFIGASG